MVEHVYACLCKIKVEDVWITKLLFFEHPERPDGPEIVVKEETFVDLISDLWQLFGYEFCLISVCRAIVLEVVTEIFLDYELLFTLRYEVIEVKLDSILQRMGIIKHSLVEVVSKVHCSRVPSCVFEVYEYDPR